MVARVSADLESLVARGVVMGGSALSEVLLVKGELTQEELGGAEPFSGEDGRALRASLAALGYQPQEWETLLCCAADGGPGPGPALLREAVCALDPATIVICDMAAAEALRNAFADDLARLDDFDEAMLAPGVVAHVCGMRALNLGGFADALSDPRGKQLMWARLKLVPPLGDPY